LISSIGSLLNRETVSSIIPPSSIANGKESSFSFRRADAALHPSYNKYYLF
jgi:hypothetical protein